MTPPDCLEIVNAVTSHQQTARQVTDAALDRAERLQDKWRAFITLAPELSRAHAERVDEQLGAGKRLPLAGLPFAVKDLIHVEGLPSTCGSKAFPEPAASTASVVRYLLDAGAVLLGKLNMHECAFGFTGENPHFGDCRNPWDRDRICGGSSSGSAVAVALGICPFTLGSDAGGSIRLPAALCGVTGLKPTYGRVSRTGGVPLAWSMDHIGPLTRTAREAALILQTLARHDPLDETSSSRQPPDDLARLDRPIKGVRLGVPRGWFYESLEPDVAAAVEQAIETLRSMGGKVVEVELPHLDEALGAHRTIIFSEAASYYQPLLPEKGPLFSDEIRPLLQAGLFLPAVEYLKAQRVRRVLRAAWAKVFESVDALLTPTVPMVAPRIGQETADLPGGEQPLVRACLDFSLPFNLSGHPAASIPCGVSGELPIGLQIVGRPFAEATVLQIAHQYQQATDWHRRVAPSAEA